MKFLYFLLMLTGGILMLRYCRWIVINFALYSSTAEKWFGAGGTYTMVKVIGVALCLLAFYYVVNM